MWSLTSWVWETHWGRVRTGAVCLRGVMLIGCKGFVERGMDVFRHEVEYVGVQW